MKLKPSLKNSGKAALLFLFSLIISFLISLPGCTTSLEPTYKEEDIPSLVKQICKDEYKLDVTTQRTPTTLWIYAPLTKILHKDFGKDKDKFLDEEMTEKLRNILTTIGRVILSADKAPEFYALVASDINIGVDYMLIGNALDIKKSYAGLIPWIETNKRYVIDVGLDPRALSDTTGSHIRPYDIKMGSFLAKQIAQRIYAYLQVEALKKYFQVEKITGGFSNDTFLFEYAIKQIQPSKLDLKKEMLSIVSYVTQTYEFDKFLMVEIRDSTSQDKLVISKARLREIK